MIASDPELNLWALLQEQRMDFTEDELLEMELHLFDAIAIKRAGGEHLVHWEASGDYN